MATLRRFRWHLAGALFVGLIAIAALQAPRPIAGEGVLYGHLWCIGIKLDDGSGYPISFWPDGWHAEGSEGVVVDRDGVVVLREGERVAIRGRLTHADGDTPCDFTEILTVDRVERTATSPGPGA